MLGKKGLVVDYMESIENDGVREAKFLVGKTLTDVRVLTQKELETWDWHEIPQGAEAFAFVFDDEIVLIPTDNSSSLPGLFDYTKQEKDEH